MELLLFYFECPEDIEEGRGKMVFVSTVSVRLVSVQGATEGAGGPFYSRFSVPSQYLYTTRFFMESELPSRGR